MKFIILAVLVASSVGYAKDQFGTFSINGVKIETDIQMFQVATTKEVKPKGTIVPNLCGNLNGDYTGICLATATNTRNSYLTLTKKGGDVVYIPVTGRATGVSRGYTGRGVDNDDTFPSYMVEKDFKLVVK
jgi:hypothetical protein